MNPLKIVSALQHIEEGKDMMRSSVELFWALFDEDSFEAHRGELGNDAIVRLLQDIRGRGDAITTAEMSVLAVHDPAAFAERLPQRLRELTERPAPSYVPDEPGEPEALFVAAHLWASRLAFYLIQSAAGRDDRLFGYGEDAGLLASELEGPIAQLKAQRKESPRRMSLQFEKHEQPFALARWGIETLLAHVNSHLAAERGEYARALEHLEHSLTLAFIIDVMRRQWESEELDDFPFPWDFSDDDWMPPWLSGYELPAQAAVGWFETLKGGPDIHKHDWSTLARICSGLSEGFERDMEVIDGEGFSWEWYNYWQRADSWAEARLTPDQLRDLREEQEDKRAEDRLRAYFFDETQWNVLPERARDELILADKAWMSANRVRPSLGRSIPNSLRKATEHILEQNLWDPLVKWADAPEQVNLDFRELRRVRKRLAQLGHEPALADYMKVFSDSGVVKYLHDHFEKKDADFIKNKVKKRLRELKAARNPEEHGMGAPVNLGELRDIYGHFLGIGPKRPGILPELVRLLLLPSPK